MTGWFAAGIVVSNPRARCQMTRVRAFKSLWVGVQIKIES